MKYPSCYLVGEGAHGEILSIAYAGDGQHQDTGGKVVHAAPHTTSSIISKSISKGTGRSHVPRAVQGVRGRAPRPLERRVRRAAHQRHVPHRHLPVHRDRGEADANVGHEASVSKIGEEQLFYLTSRGMSEDEAMALIVRGFIEPIAKELPLEYAVELNRLIELEMEGSVG